MTSPLGNGKLTVVDLNEKLMNSCMEDTGSDYAQIQMPVSTIKFRQRAPMTSALVAIVDVGAILDRK
jgi:hypothetical protein